MKLFSFYDAKQVETLRHISTGFQPVDTLKLNHLEVISGKNIFIAFFKIYNIYAFFVKILKYVDCHAFYIKTCHPQPTYC